MIHEPMRHAQKTSATNKPGKTTPAQNSPAQSPAAQNPAGPWSPEPIDLPHPADFVAPFFYFARRAASTVTFVSPSVQDVLGYDPTKIVGVDYMDYALLDDPLNADLAECQRMDLSGGQSLHTLRVARAWDGSRKVLSVQTVEPTDRQGFQSDRRHNIAMDVTESVETYRSMRRRLDEIEDCLGKLSTGEQAIAVRLVDGKLNREIARELNVSDRTVERRRASILKNLGTKSTSKVVQLMVEQEMLQTLIQQDAPWRHARNAHLVY